jgi:hypothetical protein
MPACLMNKVEQRRSREMTDVPRHRLKLNPTVNDRREFLRQQLPAHLIPSAFSLLEAWRYHQGTACCRPRQKGACLPRFSPVTEVTGTLSASGHCGAV